MITNTLRCLFTIACALALLTGGTALMAQQHTATQPGDDPRIERLLSQLTLEEKVSLLGGTGFETKPIPRLGIPPLTMTDGPLGVRWKESTAFPAGIMMAAGWNPELIEKMAAAIGREAKAKGRYMLLGPCVNIHRVPQGGRDFESYGEDPFLAARTAVAFVKGMQGEKVVATVKHFACNNQEHERDFTNVTVSERALREIYLPAFEAAVTEGGAMSVMSAYNKVNGAWCSENPHLLTEILKEGWGFRGFVVSDWGAVHSTAPTANAGLDVEMPTGKYLNDSTLLPAVKSGAVPEAVINDKVRRLLRVMVWAGLLDGAQNDKGALDTPEHRSLALQVAREGLVLLKNERNVLPLDRSSLKSLAVIGPNAGIARVGGGGSARVVPLRAVSPLDGFKNKAGAGIVVTFAQGSRVGGEVDAVESSALIPAGGQPGSHGLKAEYFANANLEGTPVVTRVDKQIDFNWGGGSPDPAVPVDNFSARWTGKLVPPKTAAYMLHARSDDGVRVYVDGKLMIENWSQHAPMTKSAQVNLESGKQYDLRIEFYDHNGDASMKFGWSSINNPLQAEAVEAAKKADAVVLCVGLSDQDESEGFDRTALDLPVDQVSLIKAVLAANSRTVVVLNSGAPVLMDQWLGQAPALIEAWYPGEEGGNAVAEAVFGDVNPSGKLPMTFLRRWEDAPAYGNYPGSGAVNYAEGIFVGYRHYDQKNLEVTFPFGYGLSYTSFAYSGLTVTPVKKAAPVAATVTLDVKNTGTREGEEVVQLYVHPVSPGIERPLKELKGFQKITLKPGELKKAVFTLNDRSLAYFDAGRKQWVVEPGKYEVLAGSSSRDIRARGTLTIE